MAITYKKIASVTVGSGGAANIDFTSIPGTYTDLVLLISSRSNRSANADDTVFRINGNTSNIYSYRQLYGFTSGAGSANATDTKAFIGQMPAASSTASTFDSSLVYFPNYAGSTNKSYSIENVWENNSSTVWQLNMFAGLWANTSAITSISLFSNNSNNFVQYSTATLYGILKA